MQYFICRFCEDKMPKRAENAFATREQIRLHLRKAHRIKSGLSELASEHGDPKYYIKKQV